MREIANARTIADTLYYDRKAVELLRRAALERLLPTFDNIGDEAASLADAEWARIKEQRPGKLQELSYREDAWEEYGAPYYREMSDVRESVINVLVAALYHLFEQLLDRLCRRLNPEFRVTLPAAQPLARCREGLEACGLIVSSFETWPLIEELRLVANVIKHGEGRSSEELFQARPGIFPRDASFQPFVGLPLTGHGFQVYMPRFEAYFDAVVGFWGEAADGLRAQAASQSPLG